LFSASIPIAMDLLALLMTERSERYSIEMIKRLEYGILVMMVLVLDTIQPISTSQTIVTRTSNLVAGWVGLIKEDIA
jgi:hypothetical protein